MAVGGTGLLTALGQTQASAATTAGTATATPDWFNVTDTTYGGGADNTGTKDSTGAINAAIQAAVTAGGGVVYIPSGTYKILSTITGPSVTSGTTTTTALTVPIYFVGDGAWATVLKFEGAGDCFRIYDNAAWSSRTTWGGGVIGLTIDGSAATGAATGIHVGDLLQYELDLTVQNFTAAGSIGVHLDNNYYWTEQFYGRVYAQNCASHVVFDLTSTTSSTATGSFERCDFDIYVNQGDADFDGVVFRNGAFTGSSSLKIRGNFGGSSTALSSAVLRLSGTSNIVQSMLDIGVECGSGTYRPQTIAFASTSNTIADCYGALNFALPGTTAFAVSNNTGQVTNFHGHIAGDTSLPYDGWVSYDSTTNPKAPFTKGFTGHVAFRRLPTGSEVMVTWAIIADAVSVTNGETIVTLTAADIASFCFSDNKVLPGNANGTGLTGNVYAPAFLTAAGAFDYAGPSFTSSGKSYWYGQAVYTLKFG